MKITPVQTSFFSGVLYSVGMWCCVLLVIARAGWRQVAKAFPAHDSPSGKLFPRQGAKIGSVHYAGTLNIHSGPAGLYLSAWGPFCIGHAPILIPWNAIHNPTMRRFLWRKEIEFDVGSPRVATIRLPKKVFEGHDIIV